MGHYMTVWVEMQDDPDRSEWNLIPDSIWDLQDYQFFHMMAGVRTNDKTEHLSTLAKERGLPENCSKEVRQTIEADPDAFGVTWFTAEEFMHYDWSQYDTHGGSSVDLTLGWSYAVNIHELAEVAALRRCSPDEIRVVLAFS
jgi:hypothetical protein